MSEKRVRALAVGAAVLALGAAGAAGADGKSVSGSSNGLSWTATSYIIGQTSTATQAAPTPPGTVGNPIYNPQHPADNGVVALILNEGAAGNFICSGSLLSDRVHILTAGHCVSSGNSTITPISATATFYGGPDPDAIVGTTGTPADGAVRINISGFSVNPLYSGDVIDDHDIAVLTLAEAAPAFAQGYSLYTGSDLTGLGYNVAGYGRRSDQGGSIGADLGTGRLRQGDNRYDTTLGDPVFGGRFTAGYFGGTTGETTYSYISDFDNGLAANDATCVLVASFGGPSSSKYCDLGRGATEVSTAGGDSGGPQFVNGQIASVTSYGLTFGLGFGDIDNTLNDTFGEFNGFVSTAYNANYINSVLAGSVPEPATWAMMLGGFALIGTMARRRRTAGTLSAI